MSRIEQALKKMEDVQKARPREAEASIVVAGAEGIHVDERVVAYHQPGTALTENFKQFNTVVRAMTQGAASTKEGFQTASRVPVEDAGLRLGLLSFVASFQNDPADTLG